VKAMMKAQTAETAIDPHATALMRVSLRVLRPTSQQISAPTSGANTTTESK
jgi:hypothetical protein